MICSFELLQAKHGDCLLLYFGPNDNPNIILVDGGPSGVYTSILKPRLLELKEAISPDDPLPISMVMVSHMDDDHINGILRLTRDLTDAIEDQEPGYLEVTNMWFNTFDDIIGNIQVPVVSQIAASSSAASLSSNGINLPDNEFTAILASTGQGRQLNLDAEAIGATINNPFNALGTKKGKLVRGDVEASVIPWETDLEIQVLHPNRTRLLEMQKKWDEDLRKAKKEGDPNIIFASITNPDTSPFNLASIVCLVNYKKKTILLTGDARGDDILAALEAQGLLKNGKMNVDILKVPHHGSDRNISTEFFKKIKAKHYVISGDGKHHNPDLSTLVMLAEGTKGRENFTVHFTYKKGIENLESKIQKWTKSIRNDNRKFKIEFIDPAQKSKIIDLLDPLAF